MSLHNWFLPHKETHKKAHLISWEALLFYILIFVSLQVGFTTLGYAKPGVLGIVGNIDSEKVIELTNAERAKQGLGPVKENEALDKAAEMKAQNMFQENYWAHFAPSGKTPWDFILGAGYKFTYAGENLAKNFYNSPDVVTAWMNSPTHRENLLNSKYKDIGVAVVKGTLNGQETTLVVQEFGTTENVAPIPVVATSGKQVEVPKQDYNNAPSLVASATQSNPAPPLIDPNRVLRIASFSVIGFMGLLLTVDLVVLYRRGVFRISSHHLAHMAILGTLASTIITSSPGSIL